MKNDLELIKKLSYKPRHEALLGGNFLKLQLADLLRVRRVEDAVIDSDTLCV